MLHEVLQKYTQLAKYCLKLQNIYPFPVIYYIQENKSDFILYNENADIVSYDKRDAPYSVPKTKFIANENALYINVNLLKNKNLAKYLIIRETRIIYQLYQIGLKRKNLTYNEDISTINQWEYALSSPRVNQKHSINSPCELDRCAFCYLIMKVLFKTHINFKNVDQNYLEVDINKLYKRYINNIKNSTPHF